ncbi:MAG TPA: AsnC family transcriptional regulator [Archaeoglobus veneficus]|nr:AsnC family transcriptional regulator [Archaeoglobus veneficus]
MDERDYVILSKLMENARISKTDIARSIGISETAIRKRIFNLEKGKVILGYRAIVDYKKANLFASFTGIDVKAENIWKVIDTLKEIKEVKSIMLTSGDHTIMVEIIAKSLDELLNLHDKISNFEGVERVCPSVVLEVIK